MANLAATSGSIVVQRCGSGSFKCAVAETQGRRATHEDAHKVSLGDQSAGMWVLDGHRGGEAARFGALALAKEFGQPAKGKLPSESRVVQGFKTVDNMLRKHFKEEDATEEKSGTTAVGVLAAKQSDDTYSLKLINCGDSRGIVVGESVLLESVDHKPNLRSEKARIKAAGGRVTKDKCPRLDGRLSVSRGLGDFEFKSDRSRSAAEQKVSCIPDVYELSGLQPGTLLILACDGLWSVMSSEVVGGLIKERLQRDPDSDLGSIAAAIVYLARGLGSNDNVTVLVAQLSEGSSWATAQDTVETADGGYLGAPCAGDSDGSEP
eukprot:TRINITY_DN30049_c0_g1_i1.p1 TRINITY_DN30049_c0_g1~~TRINITY_DN30049_c0_g1_i1.p1  ORF type:complete len:321 (+),score=45.44 TRINITY_DN30049_c0_g1_i1:135-1097(+)